MKFCIDEVNPKVKVIEVCLVFGLSKNDYLKTQVRAKVEETECLGR